MIQGETTIVGNHGYAGPSVTIATASSSKPHKSSRTSQKSAAPVPHLEFSVLQEFFKNCEVGDMCAEEDVVVDERTHFHCLLCQAVIRSASKLQDHCVRHANSKHLPQEHEMCTKYFTRYTPTCSQNCQLSQKATRHRHCKLCGGAHTDPESQGLGQHVERWHTRHYTEVKEIVDLARKLKCYLQPDQDQENQQHQIQECDQLVEVHSDHPQSESIGPRDDNTGVQYNQGDVPPGSWQTSTTQMTDGSLATVHQWTGAVPPVYPPNCSLQNVEQMQQGTNQSYILQDHQIEQHPTNSQFVIQEAAAQSGVDSGYTLHVETSSLNPSQEAASIILQMMDRAQMPATDQPGQNQQQQQDLTLSHKDGTTPEDSSERASSSPNRRKRTSQMSAAGDAGIGGPASKQQKAVSGSADIHIELPTSTETSESLPLVFKSKPLPGTVIDPSMVSSNPKVWQQCIVCGCNSYLRSLRVFSDGNKRTMNKAQTARLMSYYHIGVDPKLPGKLICKKDFDTWFKFDKTLQQLLQGSDENKSIDGLMLKSAKRPGRKPLGADKKSKPTVPSPPFKVKSEYRQSTTTPTRVPRSRRLKERMEREAAKSPGEVDDEGAPEMTDVQGREDETIQRVDAVSGEIVIVAFSEQSEEVSSGDATAADVDGKASPRYIVSSASQDGGVASDSNVTVTRREGDVVGHVVRRRILDSDETLQKEDGVEQSEDVSSGDATTADVIAKEASGTS